jgi:membrane-bound inhibitor of C-type lysozyme
MRNVRILIGSVACVGASFAYGAASAPPNPEPLVDAMFQCGKWKVDAMFEEDTMSLTIDANTYSLKAVPSASGAKYEGDSGKGKIVFWSKGHDATLKVGAQPDVKCAQLDDDEVDSDEVDD